MSPLVSRPAYGEGEPRVPKGQSGLPSGGPAKKGLPLDDSIPGTKTFVKPLDENSTPEPKDESIHRIDNPKDMPKDQSRPNEVEMDSNTSYYGLGKSDNTKTKYPYRDGIPNAHNAAFVEGMYILKDRIDRKVPVTARVAATISQMLEGLNPEFSSRSKSCNVTLKRADVPNLRWIFAVDSGNGPKVVRIKAKKAKNVSKFSKMDLHVACSCPAWQWQGPEFHSTTKAYQDPNTPLMGTASPPDIRDPERHNTVCKHVAAVLSFTKNWVLPNK